MSAHFFDHEVRPIELDPEVYASAKNERTYRLNVVIDPALRVVGFAVAVLAIWLHNRTLLPPGTAPDIVPLAIAFFTYPLVTWAALYFFFDRWRSLPFLLLFTDILMLLVAIYFSGGERSYLFFFPLFRVVDQTHTSFRRAMLFGHVVVGGYLLLVAYLALVEHRPVSFAAELVKAFILYLSVLYTSLRAKGAESSRKRVASAVRMVEESNRGLAAASRDLQDSQQQLRRVMQERERILQSAAEGIVGFDTSGRITLVNARAAKTIGYEPQDLVGRAGHELAVHARVDGSICDGTSCPLEAVLLSAREQRGENAGFLKKDGSTVPVEFSSAPMFEEGKLVGAVFAFRDVSERHRLEKELMAARDAAELASRAKSQFLANMSHELRTPLNAIIGYSEMIEEEAKDGGYEEIVPDIQKIRTAGKNLLALLTDVIDIAKIDAGRMDLAIEDVSIETLLFEIRTSIEPAVRAKGNDITFWSVDAMLRTDGAKLRRILMNLVNNANKFTDKGRIEVRAEKTAEGVAFHIADTGIGMDPEQIEHLFQPFIQADSTATRKHGGGGVGLAISRRLATLLGSRIEVQSAPGAGSTFTVVVPEDASAPPREEKGEAE